ncbi:MULTISPECIES: LysR family transcriptional regulator [unclassified Paenibacillus]|uniref:LysR family transcriptional regulator n=1 Tax=unclassified Paenibacillus TaxID=185978 RepID=UPI002404BD4C|nr:MULTISPECIES: LysR family transcriptional regulator [unclassified Paenibacillus]MDF9839782.1 DNA-binding transcriptional LysR family regulator [Paenibacillus sp. PastF-2]MDF9846362.1 DNA-binding transcriptional LysR family regulator [Paenibacillus sp. PastM-2]MDF9853288.1 DNA-binding transcriptional LysR family regulator [Paenibacillus sp. PastF-1]MDH6478208.1 DNA-binding transcriptional LysR family regulator [Paenibacillus sp. PastH-2]MDH6506293.1 DNA-binding transcriptional LysR family re
MDMEGLKSFVAVAREKSISRASQALHTSQPALSTRIRRMEEVLGFPLLERNWRGVKLTPEGYYFLPYAIRLLQDLQDAASVLNNPWGDEVKPQFEEVTGQGDRLLIGMDAWLASEYTAPIIQVLNERFPDVKVRFVTRSTTTVLDLIEYRSIHFGIHYHQHIRPGVQTRVLEDDPLNLLFPVEYGSRIEANLSNLSSIGLPFLLFDNPILLSHRHITTSLFCALNLKSFQVVDDFNVAATLIAEGLAYTMLPTSTYSPVFRQRQGEIGLMSLRNIVAPMPIQATYKDSEPFGDVIQSILERLSEHRLQSSIE